MNALLGIIVFTVVEVAGLVLWAILAGVPFNGHVGAVVQLTGFLFVEHYVAFNVGRGAPFPFLQNPNTPLKRG